MPTIPRMHPDVNKTPDEAEKVVKYMYEDKKEAKLEEIRRILESKELDEICIDMILSILVNY